VRPILALLVLSTALIAGCGGGAERTATASPNQELPTAPSESASERYGTLIDQIDYDREDEEIAAMLPGDRALWVLFSVDDEINNGGFSQLLWNSAGSLFERARAEAVRVGARAAAAILSELPAVLGLSTIPRDRSARQRLVDGLSAQQEAALAQLDNRWYDEVGSEIADRIDKYFVEHPEAFGSS
jgi:hypothetical protein